MQTSEVPAGKPSQADIDSTALPVRAPISGQGVALAILAAIALVFALQWARDFVISLLLGILFAYTLNPIVAWLERLRVPRVLGAGLVMAGVVCALAVGAYSLRGQVRTILDQLPAAAIQLSAGLDSLRRGQASTMGKVQSAASEIERATNQATGVTSTPRSATTRVVIDPPRFLLGNYLWAGSMGAAGLIGQATMVLFLTFFLLLSGNTYKKKLVRLAGPTLSGKKITVHILDDIDESIQRYLFMLLATNVLVGLLTWAALRWLGLDNAGAWAVAAGLLHLIPYLGPAVTAAGIGMAAFMQFPEPATALLVMAVSLAIATLVGTFVTTWMTGRIARMNTAAVFISLLFWTWLWGVWGMLLSMPITAIVKVVAQNVAPLHPVAELLGD
ncbi:MAG: AI-2E family transporter [Thiobacillus sp.]|nr:AI-2E family transporter [Thiobacillus sp.]